MRFLTYVLAGATLAFLFYVLAIGAELLIPFALALLLWFILMTVASLVQRPSVGTRKIPYSMAMTIAVVLCGGFLWFTLGITRTSINNMVERAPVYQAKLEALLVRFYEWVDLGTAPTIDQLVSKINLGTVASSFAGLATSITGYLGLILVYLLFLILEQGTFERKLARLVPDEEHRNSAVELVHRVGNDIRSYIWIKTVLGVVGAVLSYAVLWAFGVDFAPFWAFLIFLLYYIPTFGSIVSVFFPALITLLQFDSLTPFLVVTPVLAGIQILLGNVVETAMMGKTLNLSPLVIMLSLVLWGQIWGVVGMFLAIPMMILLTIILAKFDTTRPLAVLLSADGDIR